MKLTQTATRYDQLLAVRRQVHSRLMPQVTKPMWERAAEEIGVFAMEPLAFDTPTAATVLGDFAIYHLRDKGQTLIERELEKHPPAAGSDELVVMEAMRRPIYGVIAVERRAQGVGIQAVEIRSGASLFVHDRGLGESAAPEMMIAGNLLCTEDLWSFTGGHLLLPESVQMAVSILTPPAPEGKRLELLYGGKVPPEVLKAIATEKLEIKKMIEAEERNERRREARKAGKSKQPKPKPPEPIAERELTEDEVELNVAAELIASILEEGGAETMRYR